ncbi:hypothetical protein [Fulvivirga ligni]|uniref:hypothetical protein n=1 Tax=Fulvivirga ligni TaxID=2904246 RepID=UPI001F35A761|nr:hypothetical protein [Fulvivirga ligni]UII23055.1 hypothetical protein LVD16_07435 [Fulvivirga ligni]
MNYMNLKVTMLFVLCLLFSHFTFAQRRLIVAKKFRPPKYSFYEGQTIRFKIKGEKYWNKGLIQGLGDDFIRMHYAKIMLSEIEAIDIRSQQKNFLNTLTGILAIGAIGFPGLDTINGVLVHGESVDGKSWLIGAYLATGAVILYFIQKRKVKIGKKYLLRVGEI